MTSPQQLPSLGAMGGMHTAGIYSDMTVDGPEIGTLVVIVDRAKNLPNRKTMGKQNPYCAARLGKEAKKTDTDKRGGQTPKWDQELRFTVHESPDYNNLKVSVFNDDKKTDMIGEMWVNVEEVVIPGGGKNDGWHTLNYKGKYAGEVMLELTYYDSRPDQRADALREGARHDKKIKRRPLPADLHTTPLPHQMENTRTAGPRAMGSRTRANSSNASGSVIAPSQTYSVAPPVQYPNHHSQHEDHDYHPGYQSQQMAVPDLPELPPSRNHRGSLPLQPPHVAPHAASYHGRAPSHHIHPPDLMHSHSAPMAVPQTHDPYAHPQARQGSRRYDEPPNWDNASPHMQDDGHHRHQLQPTVEDEFEDLPPLPPSHRNSAPRQAHPRGPPARSQSMDDYAPAPLTPSGYSNSPNFRNSYSGQRPNTGYAPSSAGSSPAYGRPASSHRLPARHSIADPYSTPPRAHPLANEVHNSSPNLHYDQQYQHGYPPDNAPIIKPRAISPAPPSPAPRNSIASIRHPVQSFGLSNSPSATAASTSTPSIPDLTRLPTRKSVSPRPSTSGSGKIPFGPDDFNSFNPNASATSVYTHSQSTNPHSPYHIPNAPGSSSQLSRAGSEEPPANRPLPNPDGPITTWDGRTVDPSDHLPVHSWAPEPIKKGGADKDKVYGQGGYDANRARGLAGPRTNVHSVPATGGRVGRDLVVNVKSRHSPNPNSPGAFDPQASGGRDRLTKRQSAGMPRSPNPYDSNGGPLHEIETPNPYAGHPGSGYRAKSPALPPPGYHDRQQQQQQQQQQRHYGDLFGDNYENAPSSHYSPSHYGGSEYGGSQSGYHQNNAYADYNDPYSQPPPAQHYPQHLAHGYSQGGGQGQGGRAYSEPPPDLPPKIPFDDHGYGVSALEKELRGIDIGAGSRRVGRSPRPGSSGQGGSSGTVVARRGGAGRYGG